jgi:hypothetical protein
MPRPAPGSVIHGIAPQSPGLGTPRPGSSTGRVVSSANTLVEPSTVLTTRSYNGVSHQQARPTQLPSVERSRVMPWRASICDWRYSGRESQNLLTTTCTIMASVAMPPSIGRSGAEATTMAPSQVRQA